MLFSHLSDVEMESLNAPTCWIFWGPRAVLSELVMRTIRRDVRWATCRTLIAGRCVLRNRMCGDEFARAPPVVFLSGIRRPIRMIQAKDIPRLQSGFNWKTLLVDLSRGVIIETKRERRFCFLFAYLTGVFELYSMFAVLWVLIPKPLPWPSKRHLYLVFEYSSQTTVSRKGMPHPKKVSWPFQLCNF